MVKKEKSERNVFGFGGSFVASCDKVFDIMALGFLWILGSLPIITIGVSSAALYHAMIKCIKHNDGYISKEYFRSFLMNLRQGVILWVLTVAATLAMHLNIGILMKETDGYVGLFFICVYALVSVYILAMACYMFPALSRYEMSCGWLVKISIYMVVRYIGTTLALLLVVVCMGGIIWKFLMAMFFVPGPAAFIMSDFLERVLKKHEPEIQDLKEGGEEETGE
ncbi:MAG: YesL family protein [Dorea sp.]|nr:YesL family protein [Dorea sp.]